MITFFRAGGFSMWFVLILALACLITGIRFAFTATPQRLAVIRALSWATVFSIISGVASNLTAVMWHGPKGDPSNRELANVIIQGLGEAITPATLGFSLLSLAWMMVAVGVRRMPDGKP